MPCTGPSLQEIELDRRYKEKLKDPEFLEKEAERIAKAKYRYENFDKKKWEDQIKLENSLEHQSHQDFLRNQIDKGDLEGIAFSLFMTVFLCKAMELLGSNNLMQYTYNDMEWWWNEHKYRDTHNEESKLSKKELIQKLTEISNHYKVK